jgi:hypothetical protein
MTVWALHDPMLHDLGRHGSAAGTIVLRVPFLAGLLFFDSRHFHIRFDKRWRGRFLFFQFFE